jgi:cytoskeleton-associated protein 5
LEGVIEKGIGSTRAGSKKWSGEILKGWIEVEGEGEGVIEVISNVGITSKQPKIVAGSVTVLSGMVK